MGPERVERRLAAILAADVAGYSRLMGADEEGAHAASIALRREVFEPKIAQHRGRIVKTTGDGFLAEFASVVDAGRCAVELHREMALRNDDVPSERRIQFRIGIDGGPVLLFGHIERFEARRANMRTVAAPMLDAAPEMMATFPASLNAGFPLLLWADVSQLLTSARRSERSEQFTSSDTNETSVRHRSRVPCP